MTAFALSVWVFQETGSTLAYGTLLVTMLLPLMLGGLVSGPLIDRWDRRWVLILSDTVAAAGTLTVAVLYFSGGLHIWHIYLILFINGLTLAFQSPAQQAVIPLLVEQSRLTRAAGLIQVPDSFSTIVAPLAAGALLGPLGLGGILLIDILTYFVGVLSVFIVHIPPIHSKGVNRESFNLWRDFKVGLRYLWQARPFFYLTSYCSIMVLALGAYQALYAPMILKLSDEAALGVANAVIGVGTFFGAALLSYWTIHQRVRALLASAVVMALGGILAGLSTNLIWITVALFFGFGASPFLVGLNRVLYQLKMAPELMGRIFAFRMLLGAGAQTLGVMLSSAVAAQLRVENPIGWTLTGFAALLLIATVIASRLPTLRDLEQLMPDLPSQRTMAEASPPLES